MYRVNRSILGFMNSIYQKHNAKSMYIKNIVYLLLLNCSFQPNYLNLGVMLISFPRVASSLFVLLYFHVRKEMEVSADGFLAL